MGMDMYMGVLHQGEVLSNDIIDWRDSEWFGQLSTFDEEYSFLQPYTNFGWDDLKLPPYIKDEWDGKDSGTWHHRWMRYGDYLNWYHNYNPDEKAGWATNHTWWKYETKSIVPTDNEVFETLPAEYAPLAGVDYEFRPYIDYYDSNRQLTKILSENMVEKDDILFYCFC